MISLRHGKSFSYINTLDWRLTLTLFSSKCRTTYLLSEYYLMVSSMNYFSCRWSTVYHTVWLTEVVTIERFKDSAGFAGAVVVLSIAVWTWVVMRTMKHCVVPSLHWESCVLGALACSDWNQVTGAHTLWHLGRAWLSAGDLVLFGGLFHSGDKRWFASLHQTSADKCKSAETRNTVLLKLQSTPELTWANVSCLWKMC